MLSTAYKYIIAVLGAVVGVLLFQKQRKEANEAKAENKFLTETITKKHEAEKQSNDLIEASEKRAADHVRRDID